MNDYPQFVFFYADNHFIISTNFSNLHGIALR